MSKIEKNNEYDWQKLSNLIPVADNNGNKTVNARDLHAYLVQEAKGGQKGQDFSNWINRMIEECLFEIGFDYATIGYNYRGEQIEENGKLFSESVSQYVSKREYALTLDAAKEIAMVQKNDKGRIARKYFIECEKMLRTRAQAPMTKEQLYMQTFQMLSEDVKALEEKNQELECIVLAQDKKLESKSAKEDFTDHITSEEEFSLTVTSIGSRLNINGKKLNKILLEKHVIRSLDDDYCLTTKYLGKGYAKRILIKCHDGQFREKLRWSRFGEAFIVDLIIGLDRSKYKIQHIPISQSSSIIH